MSNSIYSNVSALNGAFLKVLGRLNIHPGFIIEKQTEKQDENTK